MESPGLSRGSSEGSSTRVSEDLTKKFEELHTLTRNIREIKKEEKQYKEELERLKSVFEADSDTSTVALVRPLFNPIDHILHDNVDKVEELWTKAEHLYSLQKTLSKLEEVFLGHGMGLFIYPLCLKKGQIVDDKCKALDDMMKTLHGVVDKSEKGELEKWDEMIRLVKMFAVEFSGRFNDDDALRFAFKHMLKKESPLKTMPILKYFFHLKEKDLKKRLGTIRGYLEQTDGQRKETHGKISDRGEQARFKAAFPFGGKTGSSDEKEKRAGRAGKKGAGGGGKKGAGGGGRKGAGRGKEKKDVGEKEKEAAGHKGKEARTSYDNLGDYADALKEACQKTAPSLGKPNLWISGIFLNEFLGFRNGTYVALDSKAPVNCIIGPSGEGKTTIFRAIEMVWHILLSSRSGTSNEKELKNAVTARGAKDATICVLLRVIHEKTAYVIGFRKRKEGSDWGGLERIFTTQESSGRDGGHNEEAMMTYMKEDRGENPDIVLQKLIGICSQGKNQSLGVVSQGHVVGSMSRWTSCNDKTRPSSIVVSQDFINEKLNNVVRTKFREKIFHGDALKHAADKTVKAKEGMEEWYLDLLKPSSSVNDEGSSNDSNESEDRAHDDYTLCRLIIDYKNSKSKETKAKLLDVLISRMTDDDVRGELESLKKKDWNKVMGALPDIYFDNEGYDCVAMHLINIFLGDDVEENRERAIIFLVENFSKIDKEIADPLLKTYGESVDIDYDHLWRQGDLLLVLKIAYGKACNDLECITRVIPRLDEIQELLALRNMHKAGMGTDILKSWCRTWAGEPLESPGGESSELCASESSKSPVGESSESPVGESSELAGELLTLLEEESLKIDSSAKLLNAIRDMARCAIVPNEKDPKKISIQHAESSAKVSLESCSSGQYDCLSALVGAFYCDIILLDEPGQNMGPSERILLRTTLERWAREHAKQVVIITHHPELLDRANPLSGVQLTTISRGTIKVRCVKNELEYASGDLPSDDEDSKKKKNKKNKKNEANKKGKRKDLVGEVQNDLRTRQALLFARKVILVEGESDVPFVEEMIRQTTMMCNVIPCNGRKGVARMKWMCDILEIKCVALLDVDVLFGCAGGHLALALSMDKMTKSKERERTLKPNNTTLRLLLGKNSAEESLIDVEFENTLRDTECPGIFGMVNTVLYLNAHEWDTLKTKTKKLIKQLRKNNVIVWSPKLCDVEGWVVPSRKVTPKHMRVEFTQYQEDESVEHVRAWPMDYVANLAGHYIITRSPEAYKRLKEAAEKSKDKLYGSLIKNPQICQTIVTAKEGDKVWNIVGKEKYGLKEKLRRGICEMLGGPS